MKKTVLAMMALAVLALFSCAKVVETEQVVETPAAEVVAATPHVIHAVIDEADATKTSYEESGSTAAFSWVQDDRMKVVVYNAESPFTADQYGYRALSTGASVDFTATGTPNYTAYPKSGFAVYPEGIATGGAKDAFVIQLPAEYTVSGTDFTAVGVPMIGTETAEDVYTFKAAVGVLKVSLSNLSPETRKLVLNSPYDNLSGVFALNATSAENGLLMTACTASAGHSITVSFPQQIAGSSIDVYIPVPVGTISAGATLEVQDGSGNLIKSTPETTKSITITRAHLTPISVTIPVEEWDVLGTGKYMDDHGFYYLGTNGRTAGDYVDVQIEQSATDAGRFRVKNPYANCNYSYYYMTNAPEYLYFDIVDKAKGIVANHAYRWDGTNLMMNGPYWTGEILYHNSRVIKFAGDDITPANVQLAPIYYDCVYNTTTFLYATDASQNPKIEIVFPGATPMLAGVFNYANGTTAEYADGKVSVTINNANVTGVKVKAVMGATEASAIDYGVEALLAGMYDLSFNASGSKALDLIPGEVYYLVYMIETDGHGSTFKRTQAFSVLPEVPLTASMITVSTDATQNGGNPYDGGTYTALVDNNLSTYWHSAYESQTGDDYDWAYLDSYYGAFIDIALAYPLKTFQLEYTTRHNNGGNVPRAIRFAVSNDLENWNIVGTIEEDRMNVGAGVTVLLPGLSAESSFSHLRIGIIKAGPTPSILTTPKGGSTSIAEITLYGDNE